MVNCSLCHLTNPHPGLMATLLPLLGHVVYESICQCLTICSDVNNHGLPRGGEFVYEYRVCFCLPTCYVNGEVSDVCNRDTVSNKLNVPKRKRCQHTIKEEADVDCCSPIFCEDCCCENWRWFRRDKHAVCEFEEQCLTSIGYREGQVFPVVSDFADEHRGL